MNKGRLVKAFIGKYLSPPWPRGKDNCLDFDFGWIEDRSSSTEFGKNFNSDRCSIHPKLKSKLGVECRKTLGSTASRGGKRYFPSVVN